MNPELDAIVLASMTTSPPDVQGECPVHLASPGHILKAIVAAFGLVGGGSR